MEQVRNRVLDGCCEGIAEERDVMNAARTEEKSYMHRALREMDVKKVTVYRHAGVEIALIPGDVHLRVRLVKEKTNSNAATAESEPEENPGEIADADGGPDADERDEDLVEAEG